MNNIAKSNESFTSGYYGRILNDVFCCEIKERVKNCIAGLRFFEKTENPVIHYIAAWTEQEKTIWYEYVSPDLTALLKCDHDEVSEIFRKSILEKRIYKYSNVDELVAKETINHHELDSTREELRNRIEGNGLFDAVYKLALQDGEIIWLKDQASIENYEQDRTFLSFGCLVDVTKEMIYKEKCEQLNVSLREAMNEIKTLNGLLPIEKLAAIGNLVTQIVHDMRNPITIQSNNIQLMEMYYKNLEEYEKNPTPKLSKKIKYLKEEMPEIVISLKKGIELLKSQVDGLLLSARPDAEKPNPEEYDLKSLVSSLKKALTTEYKAAKKDIKLEFYMPEGGIKAYFDKKHLCSILQNLGNNSIDAIDNTGEIKYKFYNEPKQKDFTYISVKDSGFGIPVDIIDKIFEPFFTTKPIGEGTGIGLSSTYKLIKANNSKIHVNSKIGQGTEFIIEMPRYDLS